MSSAFLVGSYRWANKGDAVLALSTIDWLSEIGFEITGMTSFDPVGDQPHYNVPMYRMATPPPGRLSAAVERALGEVPAARNLLVSLRLARSRVNRSYLRWVGRVYDSSPSVASLIASPRVRALAAAMASSDIVIGVPGGYLLAPRRVDDWWLFHLGSLALADGLGKPTVLAACSIGPFEERHRKEAARFLKRVDRVFVREEISREVLLSLGYPGDSITSVPDMAFFYAERGLSATGADALSSMRALASRRSGLVGASVRHHSFPGCANPAQMSSAYLRGVATALSALHGEGAGVVLVHQTEEDADPTAELKGLLEEAGVDTIAVPVNLEPADLVAVYSELDLLLGTRMHANILAMSVGTPVVAIGYEPKTVGILRSVGLEDWGISIEDVAAGEGLKQLALSAWRDREGAAGRVRRAIEPLAGRRETAAVQLAALARGGRGDGAAREPV